MESTIIKNIDFDNMSYEQLTQFEEKAKKYKLKSLDNRVSKIEDWQAKVRSAIELLEQDNKEKDEKINEIEDKMNVLSFEDIKFREFKKSAKARIYHLVGHKEDIRYILFYDSFIKKIYSDICNSLNVSKTGKIRIDDFETALTLIKRWYPSRKYIEFKLVEYQKLLNKKKKTEKELKKIYALEEYLDVTEGGKYLDF